ncbi:pentapeptide repeat-containing protein [Vibrio sp. FF59]|uniref:pentapeptide repeat-containing protein n=1 Tax=Vibrio sp. FF59 TaxID=3230011 RepID=UPI00352F45EC
MKDIQFDFEIERPVEWWCQAFSFDAKEFFSALGKTAVNIAMQDTKGATENALDMLKATGLEGQTAGVLAWELINTSLHRSIYNLVVESANLLPNKGIDDAGIEELSETLSLAMQKKPVGINSDFFTNPKQIALLSAIEQPLTDWLLGLGLSQYEASSIYLRLKDCFPVTLHQQWLSDAATYNPIQDAVTSPFLQATKIEREWSMYHSWLQEQANKPVFSEAFGLKQVYVPLRGYYEEKAEQSDELEQSQNRKKKCVVNVDEEIFRWVENYQADDAIKVISGGPGSGKSSTAKILAAEISKKISGVHVLFVPLHLFDIDDDLSTAIESFIRDDRFLSSNPLDGTHGQERILLIFDGLDELSMRGKAASDAAMAFVEEVIIKINRYNGQGHRRQAIITGRDVAVQSTKTKLRKCKQVLKLLPYYVDERFYDEYEDPNSLLKIDQRNIWWEKYARAKGLDYKELPEKLNKDNLTPITQEPLLNYLVALAFEGGRITFDENITLNVIYADLLKAVHKRKWEKEIHPGTLDLTQSSFELVLEEIALAVWHGHGRTATLSSIQLACEKANLSSQLGEFKEDAKKGVSKLLTAFYFRESEQHVSNENTFEFTHKSFGEYLIGRKIARKFTQIHKHLQSYYQDPTSFPFNEEAALTSWLELCGPAKVDRYIFDFLVNEIRDHKDFKPEWQKTAQQLIKRSITQDWPIEKILGLNFHEMKAYIQNANATLMNVHFACAQRTEISSEFETDADNNLLRDWVVAFLPRVGGHQSSKSFSYMSFPHCSFPLINFNFLQISNVNFHGGNISFGSHLHSMFTGSNFSYAGCINTAIRSTVFEDCNLDNSHFPNSMFNGGKFHNSTLNEASFDRTVLRSVRFKVCSALNATFEASSLQGVTFDDCKLSEAEFIDSRQSSVKYINSDLSKSSFSGSRLSQVIFSNVDLSGVNFSECITNEDEDEPTHVEGAVLQGVEFTNVTIDEKTRFSEEQIELLPNDLKEQYLSFHKK